MAFRLGVSIRIAPLDLRPYSSQSKLYNMDLADQTFYDNAPLRVGNQFADSADGVTIQALAFSMAGGAKVRVITTRGP